jgi:mono/diheme cytochrome c family protein
VKWHIALGTLGIVLLVGLLTLVAIGEQDRMSSFTRSYNSRLVEVGAALFENNCRSCHGPQGKGIEGVAPSINVADLFSGQRLAAIGQTGSLEDYLAGVIAAGRPIPSEGSNYPQRMPAWGQRFGGPLREDQVESLVIFIMNWEERALAEGEPPPLPPDEVVGIDITVRLPEGDVEAGEALSAGALGCAGCHELAAVGPSWAPSGDDPGIGERAEVRFSQSDYTGMATSAEEYLIEATVLPNVYLVDGYVLDVMPVNYGQRLSAQDLADLVAYMLSLR